MPVHVTNDLTVGDGTTLTIAAGSVIKLPNSASLNAQGTLMARGTSTQPIVFTSLDDDSVGGDSNNNGAVDPIRGSWDAIWLNSSESVLDYVDVRYAGNRASPGNGNWCMLVVHVGNNSTPTLSHLEILNAENQGLYVFNGSPLLQDIHITGSAKKRFCLSWSRCLEFRMWLPQTILAAIALRFAPTAK